MKKRHIQWIVEPSKDSNPPTIAILVDGVKNSNVAFRYRYWQTQGTTERFRAASALVEQFLRQNGREHEIAMQRGITRLIRSKPSANDEKP